MAKTLIIAEKPSVAADLSRALARILGKFERKGKSRDSHSFENDRAIITSAVGHLVELKMPTGPNGKKLPWKFDVLPAIPSRFELEPVPSSEGRLRHVLKQARRKDVDLIVNACDAGREGELIFQYIMDIGRVDKPVKRLWMQSMTTTAIQEAWRSLRDGAEMENLANAAKCRSESDWLVGLNSTRALTCFRSRHGGFNITAAGRVQTPTLAILAKREREIRAFRAAPYAEVHASFAVAAGTYDARWIDPDWKKDDSNPHSRPERLWDRERAEAIRARCDGRTGAVREQKKPQKQAPPQLYDLTTLQRGAPFTARQTLQIAQALYERHKMITYPRTDSRYLPGDYLANVRRTTEELANSQHPVARWAADSLRNDRVSFQRRVFNDAKVSDHFAIIPTGRMVRLSDAEAKVYDLIVKRFVAVFFPHAEFEITQRFTTIDHGDGKDTFRTDGKVLVNPGWLAVYGRTPGRSNGGDELVAVTEGEAARVTRIEILDKETTPPARYTEATLLSAMEGAGKLVEDEELREAMAERGLGTPATRAAIIEGLLRQKYIAREGRDLHVTGKGLSLVKLLEAMEIEPLTSPSMTGDWEAKLHRMEHGRLDRESFMKEIKGFTEEVVAKARRHYREAVNRVFPDLECPCPSCGASTLKQTDATYECHNQDCSFRISKYIAGRRLTEEEACELFTRNFLPPREGFVSRFNKPFEAGLELVQEETKTGRKGKFKTNFVFDGDEPESTADLGEEHLVTDLTLADGTRAQLFETEKAYHVPDLKPPGNPDGFRLGKTILQKQLDHQTVRKLLTEGKTNLVRGFVSKRTKRPFNARLTLDFDTGKIGFEFEPRKQARKKSARSREE